MAAASPSQCSRPSRGCTSRPPRRVYAAYVSPAPVLRRQPPVRRHRRACASRHYRGPAHVAPPVHVAWRSPLLSKRACSRPTSPLGRHLAGRPRARRLPARHSRNHQPTAPIARPSRPRPSTPIAVGPSAVWPSAVWPSAPRRSNRPGPPGATPRATFRP